MKRIFTPTLFLATLVLSACGGTTSTATQPPSAATQAPTELVASGGSATVDITLADNTIKASQTTFQVRAPYTFVITNAGHHAHNFNVNTPVSAAGGVDAALSGALLAVDRSQLSPGAKATVEFTFPDSATGQPLEFSCLIKKHYDDGMLLAITVTK